MVYNTRFSEITPKLATSILVNKVKKGRAMDEEMLEYFKDRSQVEEAYAKLLQKVSKKHQLDKEKEKEKEVLGTYRKLWAQLVLATADTSKCHQLMAERLILDFETAAKVRDKADNGEWSELRKLEATLNKLSKECEDKLGKYKKRQAESSKTTDKQAEAKEKKLTESKMQYEEVLNQWKNESSAIFEKFENIDRRQMEFIRTVIKKSIEFQLDNLKLQVLNHEQMLKSLTDLNIDTEIEQFANNYAKENVIVAEASGDESEIKPSTSTDTSVKDVHNDVAVDADGYRIPQMDLNKWKNEISPSSALDEEDTEGSRQDLSSSPTKFKIDIKAAVQDVVKENELENAAALFKDNLGIGLAPSSATIKRNRRLPASSTSSTQESPIISRNSVADRSISVSPAPQEGTVRKEDSLSNIFGSLGSQILLTPTLVPLSSSTTSPSPTKMDSFMVSTAVTKSAPLDVSDDFFLSFSGSKSLANTDLTKWIDEVGVKLRFQEIHQMSEKTCSITGTLLVSLKFPSTKFETITLKVKSNYPLKTVEGSPLPMDGDSFVATLNVKRLSDAKDLPLAKYSGELNIPVGQVLPVDIGAKIKAQPTQTQMALFYEAKRAVSDFSVLASTDGDATSPSTKPTAVWNPEKKKMLWKLGNLVINQSGKLLAQWEVKRQSSNWSSIAVKYVYSENIPNDGSSQAVVDESVADVIGEKMIAVTQLVTPSLFTP